MSSSSDEIIVRLATRHHGVVSKAALLDAGVSRSSVARRIGGLLQPFSENVFIVGEPGPLTELAAATAATPGAAVADLSAAALHELPTRPAVVSSIVVPHRHRPTLPLSVAVRRTRHLPPDDRCEVHRLATTTVERTLCDLSTVLSAVRLQRLIEWCIVNDAMSAGTFRACAASFCRRGRGGSARIRLLRHELLEAKPVATSELERRGRELLDRQGLSGHLEQFRPPWFDGLRGIVDFAWPDARVILELDGRRWHAITEAQENDRRRDRTAAEAGWLVVRATWDEVVHRPETLAADLRSILAQRRRSGEPAAQN